MPFRHAHHAVGRLVAIAERLKLPLDRLPDAAALEADPAFRGDWRSVFDLTRAFRARENTGMPGPRQVAAQIRRWEKSLG
jgi:argininosuccinate lyase